MFFPFNRILSIPGSETTIVLTLSYILQACCLCMMQSIIQSSLSSDIEKILAQSERFFLRGTEYFLFFGWKLYRICLKYFIMDYTFSFPTFLEVLLFSQLESCVFTLFCAPPRALIMRYRTKAGSSFTSGGLTCFLS